MITPEQIQELANEWEHQEYMRAPKDYVKEPDFDEAQVDEPSNYLAGFMAGLIVGTVSASVIWLVVRIITV